MGAFRETFLPLVTIVSRNTLLIHYHTKIHQNGHFVSQISPQKQHLQQKWSIPQHSQWKMLGDGNRKNIWRFILRGVNCHAKWMFLGKIQKIPQIAHFAGQFTPLRINIQIFFLFPSPSILHWLRCGILHFC